MTVTITHGSHYRDDCQSASNWNETEDGLTATLSVVESDFLKIDATVAAGNKTVYYEKDITNVSSNIAEQFSFKYKTSSSSIKAKIVLVFTSGSQTVLAETASTTWVDGCVDVTEDKTIDKIQIWATSATGQVYFDFLYLHEGTFTFPYVSRDGKSGGVKFSTPREIVTVIIPGREGPRHQDLGLAANQIKLSGDMDTRTEWGSSPVGDKLYQIYLEGGFQWFECDLVKCKVVPVDFNIALEAGTGKRRVWDMILELYSVAPADSTLYDTVASYWGV